MSLDDERSAVGPSAVSGGSIWRVARVDVHVVPDGSLWKLVRDGTSLDGRHASQEDAEAVALQVAADEQLEVVVHSRDGGVRRSGGAVG